MPIAWPMDGSQRDGSRELEECSGSKALGLGRFGNRCRGHPCTAAALTVRAVELAGAVVRAPPDAGGWAARAKMGKGRTVWGICTHLTCT